MANPKRKTMVCDKLTMNSVLTSQPISSHVSL